MHNFYLLAFRNLWQRKTRTLLTFFGVALGVAFVLAVSITNTSTQQSLEAFFAQASGRASLTITNAGGSSVPSGIRASIQREAQAFPGVVAAVAMTSDSAILLGKDNTNTRLTVAGIDPIADARVRVYEMDSGRFLDRQSHSFEIVLTRKIAEKHGIRLNDKIELIVGREPQTFTVIGLLANKDAANISSGAVGFVTSDVAREVFNRGNKVDQVDLVAEPSIAQDPSRLEVLRIAMQDQLGETLAVSYPAASSQAASSAMNSISMGLVAFSTIALLVSAILTYNTFSMIALERTREWGLLRSLGTGRAQLLGLVLVEALLLALIGSAAGLAGGVALAMPLLGFIQGMFTGNLPIENTVPASGLIAAAASGVIVTLLASLKPAWGVTRITPMLALRPQADAKQREGFFVRHSWQIGLGLIALSIADQIVSSMLQRLAIIPVEAFLVVAFLGVTLLVPVAVGLIERLVRRVMWAVYGMPGRLGSLNIQRNRGRAALTASVMTIGAAMTIAMGGAEISFKVELERWINETLTSDWVISSSFTWLDTSYPTLPADVGPLIAATEGVGGMTGERMMYVTVTGATTSDGFQTQRKVALFRAIDPNTYRSVAPLRFVEDNDKAEELWNDFAQGDAVFVSGLVQQTYHIRRGDTLRLRTPRGERDLRVAGIVMDISQGGFTVIGSWDVLTAYFGQSASRASAYFARLAPGADRAAVERALKEGVGKRRHLDVTNSEEYRNQVRQAFDQFFGMFNTAIVIAILIGALGVVNTLTMSILERTREIGMLRSVGMTRGQIVWMVLAEAAVMGVIAALMGIGAGLALTAVLVKSMSINSGWNLNYVFPTGPLLISIVITLVVSQLAALYPTWRAVKAVIVQAIQSE
jgi:putative ABC transport system permease protein